MRYETTTALRQALETRLRDRSRSTGVDLERLRRRALFERLLVRLELNDPGTWIVKGAMALEVRLGDQARMTRDLDLAVRADTTDAITRLERAVARDTTGDGFAFRVGEASPLMHDRLGGKGWRVHVDALLGDRQFAAVKIDVVARADGLTTDRAPLPDLLGFAGIPTTDVELVDLGLHFAEKVHAIVRGRDDGRANTRVRDLVDVALFIEQGLLPDDADVMAAVGRTFIAAGATVPNEIPDVPAEWRVRYPVLADGLGLRARTCDEALQLLRDFWVRARIGL